VNQINAFWAWLEIYFGPGFFLGNFIVIQNFIRVQERIKNCHLRNLKITDHAYGKLLPVKQVLP